MFRGGSQRGGDRGHFDLQVGPECLVVAGRANVPPRSRSPRLATFLILASSKVNTPMVFAGSVFAGRKDGKESGDSLSQTNLSSNMFFMLSQTPEMAAEAAAAKSNSLTSRKRIVDLGPSDVPKAPARRPKLRLLPRSKLADEEAETATENQTEDGEPEDTSISEAEAKKKIDEDLRGFFGVHNLEEADEYFKKLPSEQAGQCGNGVQGGRCTVGRRLL